jgi:V/A-type H+-transporting ATPase subunit F
MEGKVAVLGSSDFVLPFSALGVDTFPVEAERETVLETASEIVRQNYALIVVAENIAILAQEAFEDAAKKAVPCVLVVPFATESEGFATNALGRALKMATGINILTN